MRTAESPQEEEKRGKSPLEKWRVINVYAIKQIGILDCVG